MMDYRYNNKIETDIDKSVIQPLIVLATRSGRKIGVINNIQELRCNHPLASASEISFDVYKEINGVKNPYWDLIKDFKFIYLPTVKDSKFKWYEITIAIDEGNDTIKHVTGIHANEAELGQLMLYNVEINTEEDINRDDYEIITIDDKEYGTVFYNPDHPKASLLHRILSDKASHYSILHVDETLKNIQREFSFNGTSIVDALNQTVAQEIGCLFVYGQNPNNEDDGIFHRTISAYDLMDYCEDCGERGTYTQGVCTKCGSTKIKGGYGKDTGIFINSENLSDSISLTSSTDQVKNFFKMGAGDEYMEAAIRNCNPNGSNYLYYFSDEMKEDMSDELISKLDEYNTIYDSYLKDYNILLQADKITDYNALVRDYQPYIKEDLIELQTSAHGYEELTDYYYNSLNFKDMLQTVMMPASEEVVETTAQEQLDKLNIESMSPIGVEDASAMSLTAADTAVKSYARVYVDVSRYKIELSDSAYVNNYWTGTITITSLTDEEDTASKELTLQFNNDGATFLKQKIEKTMKEHEAEDIGDVSFLQREYTDEELIDDFKPELKKYSLDALSLLDDLCVAVMDILADANQGEETSEYYEDFYHPFWKKRNLIMAEEKIRESEIATVESVIVNIEEIRADIINYLDLHNYFGDELYSELMLYRRETEYSNPNFISDGLSDSEVIDRARDYFKRAQEEIIKASTLQHSISASLYNLFLIPEFRKTVLNNDEVQYQEDVGFFPVETFSNKLINLFDGGNWLRIRVDDKIYKLRLTNWEINYDDPEQLEVEFSDVVYSGNTVSDIASVLSQAKTMATSYDAVMRQAEKGNTANNTIEQTKKQGLILNQNKIINNVDSQSFVLNSQGALMRAKNDFDDGYSPEQIKLLNKGIYYTNDDWETVKAGLGHFTYYDPETKTVKEDYGIIASTIVGQLLLGENLKIYSESGKFEMGDNGLVITAVEGEDNTDLFVVQKEKTDEQGRKYVEKYIYVDSNGEVQIRGNSVVLGGKPLIEYINDAIDDADIDVSLPVSVQLDSSTGVVFNSDSISATLTATVYRGGTDITSQITEFVWTKRDKNGNVDSSWTKTTSINTLDVNIDNINDKVIIGCEVEVPQEGVTTTSYGSITISKIHDGSQFWTSTVTPTSPDYTFTVSDLVGDTNADIKDGDIIYYSHYRYTVTSVSANGTTVLCGNRESLRGADGISPTVKSIVCSHSAVVCEKDGSYNPNTITFNGQAQTQDTISSYKGWFVIELSSDAQTWVSNYSSASKESFVNYKIPLGVNITKDGIIYYQGSTITVNGSVVNSNFTISSDGVITTTQDIGFIIRSIRCSLYSDSNKTKLIDQQRVNIAFDGVDGENGDDGYTVVLSNENHTFAGNTTSAIASEMECNVIAYKGTTQVVATIGTITGQPTGMTTSLLNNGTVNTAFKVTVDTTMITKNGVLNIPVTVDGKSFTKKFTYTLTLDGEKGDKGDTAQWYYGEALTHTSGTATLSVSQTDDVAVGAMYLNTKTGSCYKCTAISGSNATWTYAGNITDSIDIDRRNLIWNTASPNIISWNNSKQLYGWAVQSGGNGIGSIEIISDSPIGGLNKTFRISNNTSGNKDFAQVVMPELNTNFNIPHTFSAYVRGVGDNATALIRSWNNTKGKVAFSQSITVTTEWQKVEVVFQSFTNSVAGDSLDVRFGLTGVGSIEYIAPKFELGEKATGWTPAPEDINAEISTKADSSDAVYEEQLIYISKASSTLSVDGTTTWVSESGDVQNTWSTKRPTYNTNYPVLFIAKQRKTVSGTISCTTPIKDDTTTVIDGGHITTGTIDASVVNVTNINANEIKTGTISIGTVNGLQSSLDDKASNSALANATGWSVIISVTTINYSTNSATLEATVYKDGTKQTTGFTLEWYKTKTTNGTTSTSKLTTTTSTLSVTDLEASYTCVVN